jgi:hypothetical protein
MRRLSRRSWTLGLASALALVAMLPASAEAQGRTRFQKLRPDGEPAYSRAEARRGFRLFGLADAAYADIRNSNKQVYFATCNLNGSMECDLGWAYTDKLPILESFWYLDWAIGSPPSVRDKILATVPAAAGYAKAMGGGWNMQFRSNTDGTDLLLPSDGWLGQYMSGAASTNDKTCLDHTHNLAAGNPLLPTSDCPQTWGPLGWQGRRPITEAEFLAEARANPSNFKFEFWKIPTGEPDPSGKLDRFFGSFQTYGAFSDYSKDEVCGGGTLRTYGEVARGLDLYASCPNVPASKPGYPLGLEIRFDAFTYGIPALQDVIYYQATVTNNSKLLFGGNGVDYDSLYFGPMPSGYSETQRNMIYHRPESGAIYTTVTCSHVTPICNGAANVADLKTSDVVPPSLGGTGAGPYEWGTSALVILKSPIGDLRNKLFSRPTSPFSTVAVPANVRDDTITFQHAHLCGFRACNKETYQLDYKANSDYARRTFGMISSTDLNVLGNRNPATLGGSVPGQMSWHTFRSADWPSVGSGIGTGPANFPQTGGFNRWAPPGWDWNNDGVQDTLYFDTCSNKGPGNKATLAGACVGIFSDTMPHSGPDASTRWLNGYSNVGGTATVGPISLKAGESVGFILASVGSCCGAGQSDSIAVVSKVNAAIDHYMNFFLGPEPLPRDTIVAAEVIGGNQTVSRVRLTFTETAENARDPFLGNVATKYATAQVGTPDYVLRTLNPTLVDSLNSLAFGYGTPVGSITAAGNFSKKYIYKSCDGGNTYTNNANCAPAPAIGGPFAALGWLPYATLERDPATGDLPNEFVDENVSGGTTYTYVIVSETRGANFILQTGDAFETVTVSGQPQNICSANCATKIVTFAPSLFNALSTSGPNTRAVYVPASQQAGSTRPLVVVKTVAGAVDSSAVFVTMASETPVAGKYTLTFYDSVRVTVRDSMDSDGKVRLGTTSTVDAFKGSPAVMTRFGSVKVGGVGLNGGTVRSAYTSGQIRVVEYVFTGTTAVLNGPTGAVLVTNDLSETATPETFYSSTAFPGFRLGFNALTPLAYNTSSGEQFKLGDKVINELTKPFVRVRLGNTTVAPGGQGGRYRITWGDKPYGPSEPFRIDRTNPQRTDSAVRASLIARANTSVGVVTPEAATITGIPAGDLVAVNLPFTIYNESFQRPVQVAMRRRTTSTIRLGTGADTATVTVPEDEWIPGDALVLIEDVDEDPAVTANTVTFTSFTLGCDPSLSTYTYCNPIALLTPGASTWITTKPGTEQRVTYNPALTTDQQFEVTVAASRIGDLVASADLRKSIKTVRAVPNPYVAFSNYINPRDPNNRTRPLLFTHVPPRGRIRIYTVSGQLVQQLTWVPTDLNDTGDMIWDLRTREGLDVAGGLYMFMVTGLDANGREIASHLGKFVIVR